MTERFKYSGDGDILDGGYIIGDVVRLLNELFEENKRLEYKIRFLENKIQECEKTITETEKDNKELKEAMMRMMADMIEGSVR